MSINSMLVLNTMSEEEIIEMQSAAHLYRVLTSVYLTNSIDPTTIIENIYDHFDKQIPVEIIADVVNKYLPIVQDPVNGFMVDGELTEEGAQIAEIHYQMFMM